MCLKNSITNFDENTSAKKVYLSGTLVRALSTFKLAILALIDGYTLSPKSTLKAAVCTIKVLCFRLKTVIINSFFPINLTYLIVRSISPVV